MLKKGASCVLGTLSCSRTVVVRSARQSTCGLAEPTFLNIPNDREYSIKWVSGEGGYESFENFTGPIEYYFPTPNISPNAGEEKISRRLRVGVQSLVESVGTVGSSCQGLPWNLLIGMGASLVCRH